MSSRQFVLAEAHGYFESIRGRCFVAAHQSVFAVFRHDGRRDGERLASFSDRVLRCFLGSRTSHLLRVRLAARPLDGRLSLSIDSRCRRSNVWAATSYADLSSRRRVPGLLHRFADFQL